MLDAQKNQIALAVNNSKTMSSRQIAVVVNSRHDSVKRTIERLAESGVISFTPMVETSHEGAGSRPVEVYAVNERDSYVVVAQLSPEFTANLVDYWQATKSNTPTLPNFTDPADAAIAWASEYKAKQAAIAQVSQLETKVSELAPKAKALATLASGSQELLCLTDAAKHLHITRNLLTNLLFNQKWIYRRKTSTQRKGAWTAYDSALRQGYLYHDYTEIEKPYGTDYSAQVLVTKKGMAQISQFLAEIEVCCE